jgi:alkylation response protein AidB-like acyl-CoA dehydrogenase
MTLMACPRVVLALVRHMKSGVLRSSSLSMNISLRISMSGVRQGRFQMRFIKKAAKAGLLGFGFSAELGGWTEDVDLYHRIQRNQRESRIVALGGGTEEVLSDLAAR